MTKERIQNRLQYIQDTIRLTIVTQGSRKGDNVKLWYFVELVKMVQELLRMEHGQQRINIREVGTQKNCSSGSKRP